MRLQCLVFLLPLLLGLQSATQFVAHRFAYQPALGSPLLEWGTWWIYGPWQYVRWVQKAGRQYPQVFNYSYLMLLGGVLLGALLWQWRLPQAAEGGAPPPPSARWATPREIRRRDLW